MLKKIGVTLLLLGLILAGCSSNETNSQSEDVNESTNVTTEQTEKEGSNKAFEYSTLINTTSPDFINIVSEVRKGEIELSGVYTERRYIEVSSEIKPLIENYRTEVINLPEEEKTAHEIYNDYLTDLENAMLSFERAIEENDKSIVVDETIPYLLSLNEELKSWGREMGIPSNN